MRYAHKLLSAWKLNAHKLLSVWKLNALKGPNIIAQGQRQRHPGV
jgi:hypothetical protein